MALASTLAPTAAFAMKPQTSFFVGTCNKKALPDIPSAITAANNPAIKAFHKNITICPGTYVISAPQIISTNNLTIKGKPGAKITTSPAYGGSVFEAGSTSKVVIQRLTFNLGADYSGELIELADSTNAKVQNLVINGNGTVHLSSVAIDLFGSSGAIQNNKITNWYSAAYDGTNPSTVLKGSGSSTNTIRITGNHITNYEGTAIDVSGVGNALVTGNKIFGQHVAANPAAAVGIVLTDVHAGRVAGSNIMGGAYPASNNTVGILNQGSSSVRISGNKIGNWDDGIAISLDCTHMNANSNVISGNKLVSLVDSGIHISLPGNGCDNHADHTLIRGNTIANPASGVAGASAGIQIDLGSIGANHGFALMQTIKGNTVKHFASALFPAAPVPGFYTGTLGPNAFTP